MKKIKPNWPLIFTLIASFLVTAALVISFYYRRFSLVESEMVNLGRNLIVLVLILVLLTLFNKQVLKITAKNILAVTLLMSGISANFFERLFFGQVVDYISVQSILDINYPIFNLADIYIAIGSIWLIFWILRKEKVPQQLSGDRKD